MFETENRALKVRIDSLETRGRFFEGIQTIFHDDKASESEKERISKVIDKIGELAIDSITYETDRGEFQVCLYDFREKIGYQFYSLEEYYFVEHRPIGSILVDIVSLDIGITEGEFTDPLVPKDEYDLNKVLNVLEHTTLRMSI